MKFPHHLMHYIIGCAALAIAICSFLQVQHEPKVTIVSGATQSEKVGRFDWPTLGQDKTITLGEAVQNSAVKDVAIFCSSTSCHQLSLDMDDAMQIAGVSDSFESDHVDSESGDGIFVGPPGADASLVADAINKSMGVKVGIVPIDGINGVGIIIGKYKGVK